MVLNFPSYMNTSFPFWYSSLFQKLNKTITDLTRCASWSLKCFLAHMEEVSMIWRPTELLCWSSSSLKLTQRYIFRLLVFIFKLMILLIVAWDSLYIFCKSFPLLGNESYCLVIWKICASLRSWSFFLISKDLFIWSSSWSMFSFLILAQYIYKFSCSSSARMRKTCNVFLLFIWFILIYQ